LAQGAKGVAGRNKALTAAGGVAGLGILLPQFLGDEETVDQAAIDAQAAAADAEALATEPPPTPPEPSFLSKAGDVVGGLLSDKKLRAGLIRASKPTEGFVPRSFAADVYEGGRDYEIEQAKLNQYKEASKTAMQKNYELIKSINPGMKDEDALDLLLTKSGKSEQDILISLFAKRDANLGPPTPEEIAELKAVAAMLSGGEVDPSATTKNISLEPVT
jgi:hypothetical protein